LDVAHEHSFAVPAFNISDYAMFNGIIEISEERMPR
jgi:fructose-bisphosphate aldolase class II